jgi:hypothetical protein
LQIPPDAFISAASLLEPREDLHDFILFADRPRASEANAGCIFRRLTAFFDSFDRADCPTLSSKYITDFLSDARARPRPSRIA